MSEKVTTGWLSMAVIRSPPLFTPVVAPATLSGVVPVTIPAVAAAGPPETTLVT